jgi:hypothetical protein
VEYVRAYLHEHFGVPFNGSTLQYEGRTLIDPMSLCDFGGTCFCVGMFHARLTQIEAAIGTQIAPAPLCAKCLSLHRNR